MFRSFTKDLERMAEWLKQHQVRHVAMESTGVYWKPVWNVLEAKKWKFSLVLVNPQQVRALPGKKTDREDSERIARYLQEGLLRSSFVPTQATRDLRELTRRRTHLEGDRNRVINRIGRLLETANVKLGSVLSNIVGKSGRAILDAIARGETKPESLADHIVGRVKCTREEFVLALERPLYRSLPLAAAAVAAGTHGIGSAGDAGRPADRAPRGRAHQSDRETVHIARS